jgi:hypothetical protein
MVELRAVILNAHIVDVAEEKCLKVLVGNFKKGRSREGIPPLKLSNEVCRGGGGRVDLSLAV